MADRDTLPSLSALDAKIRKARAEKEEPPAPPPQPSGLGLAMRMGIEFVCSVAVGATTGYWLDRWLETSPWLFLVCFALGTAAGFKTLITITQRISTDI